MKALIIEDEKLTAERLVQLIKRHDEAIEIIDVLSSVEKAVQWFKNNSLPDILFLDIHLSDGNSFEILEHVNLGTTPVIFTTAYNEYAIKAFEVNSIDYLLKPIEYERLEKALKKFQSLEEQPKKLAADFYQKIHSQLTHKNKTRYLTKIGDNFNYIDLAEVAYFMYDNGLVWLIAHNGKKYPLDSALDKIELEVPKEEFHRINRKFIVNIQSIEKIKSHTNSRLKLTLTPKTDIDVIVSRERVGEFKNWLDS